MNASMLAAAVGVLALMTALVFFIRRRPRKLKTEYFTASWKELQQFCKDKTLWPQALARADRLLDEALKKRRFRGKTMGERLVAAQRKLSNNDSVWYAHNLCKKTIDEADLKLREADVKQALMGIRQALKDLGAFQDDTSSST